MAKMDTVSGTMSSFPTSPASTRNIFVAVYMSEGFEDNASPLIVFDICIETIIFLTKFQGDAPLLNNRNKYNKNDNIMNKLLLVLILKQLKLLARQVLTFSMDFVL